MPRPGHEVRPYSPKAKGHWYKSSLSEQRRIVAKVDKLMAVLDRLDVALTTARATSEKLLAATVAGLHAAE